MNVGIQFWGCGWGVEVLTVLRRKGMTDFAILRYGRSWEFGAERALFALRYGAYLYDEERYSGYDMDVLFFHILEG